ncbi:MAG: hypothetical protein ACT4P1_03195 [Sporichthyaceae bacterium]
MTPIKKSKNPVEVRNIKAEAPLGVTWEQAVDLLAQGYACEHVAKKTGFPVKMLECERKNM